MTNSSALRPRIVLPDTSADFTLEHLPLGSHEKEIIYRRAFAEHRAAGGGYDLLERRAKAQTGEQIAFAYLEHRSLSSLVIVLATMLVLGYAGFKNRLTWPLAILGAGIAGATVVSVDKALVRKNRRNLQDYQERLWQQTKMYLDERG